MLYEEPEALTEAWIAYLDVMTDELTKQADATPFTMRLIDKLDADLERTNREIGYDDDD